MEPPQPSLVNANSWARPDFTLDPAFHPLPFLVALLVVLLAYATWDKRNGKLLPVINPLSWMDWTGGSGKSHFVENSIKMIPEASQKFGDRPYVVNSDVGRITVLPAKYVEEIRNEPKLNFLKNNEEEFHGHLPGFEPFKADFSIALIVLVARRQLTKFLTKITKPLSIETSFALKRVIGDSPKWNEVNIVSTNLNLVARLSSRVFLGPEICRNDAWLHITTQYTVDSFKAAYKLRLYPASFRRIVNWFLPETRVARAHLVKARSIIQPVLDKRSEEKRAAAEKGLPMPHYDDAIAWAEEESKKQKYEPAMYQLGLSNAAIHTTTDLLSQTIINLLSNPELIKALREEVIGVLREQGWTKLSLFNLKLMDSVIKETQRMKPIQLATMTRIADADVHLSDGVIIRKGSKCAVANTTRYDSTIYENPEVFDGYRFLRMRQTPGKENYAHLVSTGPESLGFGHGAHACPGRFFAANELKVALCHLLLKYDMKLSPNTLEPRVSAIGFSLNTDRKTNMMIRRRKEEIDIDALE
ncbi:cytochrome P450 [Hypoxylon crocopeplum]|nr:cytochrome P450 [Hypoxylon crocopeplum]